MPNPFSILAHTYNQPTGDDKSILLVESNDVYYASRKYNGQNAIWDGGISKGKLASEFSWYSRGGDKVIPVATGLWTIGRDNNAKVIQAPDSFLSQLPKQIPIQGELWYKDDKSYIDSACRMKKPDARKWEKVKLVVYNIKCYEHWDLPSEYAKYLEECSACYYDAGWIQNISTIMEKYQAKHSRWFIPRFMKIKNQSDIDFMIDLAEIHNWEGVMFQNIFAKYECKRSHTLLKWKPTYDAEATVIGYEDGKTGKNIGKVGSLMCEMTWDDKVTSMHGGKEEFIGKTVTFCVSGLEDEEHDYAEVMFPIGTEINFKFKNVSVHGTPISCNLRRDNGQDNKELE